MAGDRLDQRLCAQLVLRVAHGVLAGDSIGGDLRACGVQKVRDRGFIERRGGVARVIVPAGGAQHRRAGQCLRDAGAHRHLRIEADQHDPDRRTVPFDDRIRRQRGGECDVAHRRRHPRGIARRGEHARQRLGHADRQIAARRQRLRLGEHALGGKVDDDGIGVGAAGVDADGAGVHSVAGIGTQGACLWHSGAAASRGRRRGRWTRPRGARNTPRPHGEESPRPMHALGMGFLVAAAVFGGALVGLSLHRLLPDRHLSKETQDVVRLGTGMLSVLASLVLGLLIATAKSSYDGTDVAVRTYCADLILLDETLRDYGDAAVKPRHLLHAYTAMLLHDVWEGHGTTPFLVENRVASDLMEHVRESIRALQPVDAGQHWLQDQALSTHTGLLRQRWLLIERAGPSVRPVVIAILAAWIAAIFVSFGLNAPRNGTVVAAFLVCAGAIGTAIFLVLQLDDPFGGILKISGTPVRIALAHMLPG